MENARYLKHHTAVLLCIFLIFSFSNIFAQQGENELLENTSSFWNNVRFGGSLGLGFGSGYFNGSVAPAAIYDFNAMTSAGVSLSGAYAKQNNFKATSLGGSIIGMFRPIKEIQLSTEYEQLNINRRYEMIGSNYKEQYWVPALYLGIGYNTGPVVTGVRYDVLHDSEKSFYSNAFMPFVSIYF